RRCCSYLIETFLLVRLFLFIFFLIKVFLFRLHIFIFFLLIFSLSSFVFYLLLFRFIFCFFLFITFLLCIILCFDYHNNLMNRDFITFLHLYFNNLAFIQGRDIG